MSKEFIFYANIKVMAFTEIQADTYEEAEAELERRMNAAFAPSDVFNIDGEVNRDTVHGDIVGDFWCEEE